MDDEKIIELYFARDESAITATAAKYGRLCRHIASGLLKSREDCEECVNDTFMTLWRSIPPENPVRLMAYIGKITRNLALKRYEYISADKRNSDAVCSLEELNDCISGRDSAENLFEARHTENAINSFLKTQSNIKRAVFVRRYWFFDSIDDICSRTGFSRSKVTSMLHSMRQKLKKHLESEGIEI